MLIPYTDYLKENTLDNTTIPNEVVGAVIKQDITPIKAWREYLHISTTKLATLLGVSETEYTELENQEKPNKTMLEKIASVLSIKLDQLNV
ncbi:helix-turn-helix domain-containing protein [Methylomonas rosea]|uniref:Helix-turn-helix domain-containing protein n=1 Tax=Methylomonas rosea TaxID=2952227 RepID=A0ABT1TYJ3_9GAMM|nr:helix-turn-helix transcriptional regulator [Methylomonas sp. WSC-7]MCQ8119446.1 helix-turn-helix domain-containing protein [Methylomonas sp. WSC-7]